LRAGEAERALRPLEESIRLAPERTEPLFNAALANVKLGKHKRARELFSGIMRNSPDNPQADKIRLWLSEIGTEQK